MVDEPNNLNRRDILRGISGTAIVAGGIGALSNTAAAEETELIKELDGDSANEVIGKARRSEAYRSLRYVLKKEEGYTLRREEKSAFVVSPPDSESFRAVIFEYDPKQENQSIEIGVPIDEASTLPAKATVFKKNEEEFPLQVDEYVLASDTGGKIVTRAKSNDISAEETGQVSRTADVITTSGGVSVIRYRSDMSRLEEQMKTEEGDVSIAVNPIPGGACPMSNVPCWACKDAVSIVNVIGCGAYVWLICAAAGIPSGGLAALGCGTAVGVICWAILHYGVSNPGYLCRQMCAC